MSEPLALEDFKVSPEIREEQVQVERQDQLEHQVLLGL